MNACLENIIGLGFGCDDTTEPVSGYYLRDAPELSTLNIAAIANEDYESGVVMVTTKARLAKIDVFNDLVAVLTGNNIIANINNAVTSTGTFTTDEWLAPQPQERGIVLYKNKAKVSGIRALHVKSISVYSKDDYNNAQIKIYDNGVVATYTANLTAGQVTKIQTDYVVVGDYAKIVMDNTSITVGHSALTCFVGCNGAMPNDCGYVKGWNGTSVISGKEGYGINVEFQCLCDFQQLLCNLATPYVGKILWLKTRLLIAEEWQYSNRNNSWVTYNTDQIDELIKDLKAQYVETWNTFIGGLPNVVNTLKEPCLSCKQGRWQQNI